MSVLTVTQKSGARVEMHAVFATCRAHNGERATFRIGQPVDWRTAQDRWLRLDDMRRAGRTLRLRWLRRFYRVEFLEVRAVDYHGVGLGSLRHAQAFNVAYRELST